MSDDLITELQQRVRDLEDRLYTLTVSVAYREDQPYFAEVSRSMLSSEDRSVLGLVMSGILDRASGQSTMRPPEREHLTHPALDKAFSPGPITYHEAVQIVSMLVGSEESASRIIEAHRLQGFGEEAHRHLTASSA
ncbi:hypothetical protein [Sanguibacter antarcticus]|uniref:Uncharacterized protein n=1 Tax=Sanguibacter antarcticus TaxID=372484 RepID=A0A2A9E6Q0_9MICO|nr:hypothetical protein [Sanguibacter antarcticus]PFG33912.1 hypothetical protein ATL42_1806 [Sanguibacter antarcticus]